MARRRRGRKRSPVIPALVVLAAIALGVWWSMDGDDAPQDADATIALAPRVALTSDRPEVVPDGGPRPGISERGAGPQSPTPERAGQTSAERVAALVKAGEEAVARDDPVAARSHFSEALAAGAEEPELSRLRAELTRLGEETVFSPRICENDPFVERYVINTGDSLGKIARQSKVSSDFLAAINGIRDKNRIRAGQVIKVVKGPFRAVVDKSSYSLDVYLGNTFLRHFKVGLGADGSTPTGEWQVGAKLKNPTYYPPRGGNIVAADDPENPLGERWIGLVGIGGEAAGQQRYGIHGTIEPESIGQNMSLGCIRMYNEDVELLYSYLVEKYSTITIRK
jgi:lipoprotein-anchoring transpeptidase ErfK/SrfK